MITVVILTKNSEKTISNTLNSLKDFDEVIILDTGSEDNTLDIVKEYKNTKIHKNEFIGFGILRNLGASFAKNDWILALDSDEVLSDNLIKEIFSIQLNNRTIYDIPFHNYYNNRFIKCCGWHPESHVRLYNKKTTSFKEKLLHEKIIENDLRVLKLKNPIFHYSFNSIDDFIKKTMIYSSLFAQENKNKKKSSFLKAISHGIFAFIKSYFLKRGIFFGFEGFIISLYNANCAFYKYLKLYEINRK